MTGEHTFLVYFYGHLNMYSAVVSYCFLCQNNWQVGYTVKSLLFSDQLYNLLRIVFKIVSYNSYLGRTPMKILSLKSYYMGDYSRLFAED